MQRKVLSKSVSFQKVASSTATEKVAKLKNMDAAPAGIVIVSSALSLIAAKLNCEASELIKRRARPYLMIMLSELVGSSTKG